MTKELLHLLVVGVLITFFPGCSNVKRNELSNQSEILSVLNSQRNAWNQGNIDEYMNGYWKNDSLRFIGGKTETLGWVNTLNRYKSHYKSKEEMGQLEFTHLHFYGLSDSSSWVDGIWTLSRTQDTLQGTFTILVKRIDNKWKIVVDHSS
jgi:hypothetical protein